MDKIIKILTVAIVALVVLATLTYFIAPIVYYTTIYVLVITYTIRIFNTTDRVNFLREYKSEILNFEFDSLDETQQKQVVRAWSMLIFIILNVITLFLGVFFFKEVGLVALITLVFMTILGLLNKLKNLSKSFIYSLFINVIYLFAYTCMAYAHATRNISNELLPFIIPNWCIF